VAVVVALAALVGLATSIWWPASPRQELQSECVLGSQVAELPNYLIPAVLVNSPFGGNATGFGLVPSNFPGAWEGAPPENVTAVGFGSGASNGTAESAFFTVNVSVFSLVNVTQMGSPSNLTCALGDAVVLRSPSLYGLEGGLIMGPNNTSDRDEPTSAALPSFGIQPQSLIFNNSFFSSNLPNITTCGGLAQSRGPIATDGLSVWSPILIGGVLHVLPYRLPFQQTFRYSSPANFGTWEVDNLGAGPNGGGYAFSYTPCHS
jgi:hypothetical protein